MTNVGMKNCFNNMKSVFSENLGAIAETLFSYVDSRVIMNERMEKVLNFRERWCTGDGKCS